jgi:hypothetical protein
MQSCSNSVQPQTVLAFIFWSIVFGVAYTQAPLYYSNQNQYFLHGLTAAGCGDLDHDWLANTKDPTPIFSTVVALTARHLHEWFFYGYYFLILGLYFHTLVGLFGYLVGRMGKASERSPAAGSLATSATSVCFVALLVVVHAGITRWVSAQLFGVDYPWFLQAGVAGQYVLGFGLQPSAFGVFLLASILAFVRGRPWRAVVWACLAAIIHATYLPAAAFLTLAYMLERYRQRGTRDAVLLGALALALVLPTVVYNLVEFGPSAATDFAQSQYILAHVRIPHHAVVDRWLDAIAWAQILWIMLGLFLARRSLLFLIILIPFLGSAVLTAIEYATDNDTLALLFPWRTSVLLVPLATTIVLTRIVVSAVSWLEGRRLATKALVGASGFMICVCFAGGLAVPIFELGYRTDRDELPMLDFVAKHHRQGNVYLVPVELPKPGATTRGVYSSNFTPAPRRGKAGGFLAIDLQRFRIYTGAPIYVDFKSIPYKDEEVLEWYRRIRWCTTIYGDAGTPGANLRAELSAQGISHVVVPASGSNRFVELGQPLYRDEAYCIFQVR